MAQELDTSIFLSVKTKIGLHQMHFKF